MSPRPYITFEVGQVWQNRRSRKRYRISTLSGVLRAVLLEQEKPGRTVVRWVALTELVKRYRRVK